MEEASAPPCSIAPPRDMASQLETRYLGCYAF